MTKKLERTPAIIQAEIDALIACHDELGANIRASRDDKKLLDFARLFAWEGERGHIDGTQLPALRAELAQVQRADELAGLEQLDAQRDPLQAASRAARLVSGNGM